MSEHMRSQSGGLDAYSDHQKAFSSFDFFINPTTDPVAPHPEIFESELDSSLADFEGSLDLLSNSVFTFPITDTFFNNTPSTFTSSSDSAYDTVSTRSESFYNYPNSPYSASTFSFADMDLAQVHPRGGSDYASSGALSTIDSAADPTSFGPLPPTPPRSPLNPANKVFDGTFANSACFSDYSAASRAPVTPDQYFSLEYGATNMSHPTVSPMNVSTRTLGPASAAMEELKMDPRRKHKCSKCTRAFARAFNLKTHMATHDPNRLKPHICPHRNCARSFSRKHDLGRHLTSIHRDEALSAKRAIGVGKASRSWCDTCGKGFVGRGSGCACHDVK